MLGDLSHPDVTDKLTKIRKVVRATAEDHASLRTRLKSVTDINNKLAQSYDVSLRIIVDVSKLLNEYIAFFNEIEDLVDRMNTQLDDGSTREYIRYINRLTSDNIDKMTQDFRKQLDALIPVLAKNKMDTSNLREYGTLLESINSDAKVLVSRQEKEPTSNSITGGNSSKPSNKSTRSQKTNKPKATKSRIARLSLKTHKKN